MKEEEKNEGQVTPVGSTPEMAEPQAAKAPSIEIVFEKLSRILEKYEERQNLGQSFADDYRVRIANFLKSRSWTKDSILQAIGLRPQSGQLESEIRKLRLEIYEKAHALTKKTADAAQKDKQVRELERKLQILEEKQRVSHLLDHVGDLAQEKLRHSADFRAQFDFDLPCVAYVLSIDIRRSTELMLKARDPKLFAEFLTTLANEFRKVILVNYGIFDKFTGDGILAFFPEFFSGRDAGYFALKSATTCHDVFASHYQKNRRCFISVLKDIGLGIGLGYGDVQLVQLAGNITVVGKPAVYACRMSGAKAGHTYVTEPAFDRLSEKHSSICSFDDREIDVRHEGTFLVHSATLNDQRYSPALPDWTKSTKS
jgi:class 3 adenylate cyclase